MVLHHDIVKYQKRISGNSNLGKSEKENQLFLEKLDFRLEIMNEKLEISRMVFVSGMFLGMKLGKGVRKVKKGRWFYAQEKLQGTM